MKYTTLWTLGFVCTGIALGACSSDSSTGDDDDDSTSSSGGATSSGGSSANGVTACGNNLREDVKCQAGQYCEDQTLSICTDGCLSNTNCADDQECIKADGENKGSCQKKVGGGSSSSSSSSSGGGGATQDAFCEKAQACDTSITDAQCAQLYAATNDACHECVVDSNCGAGCDTVCGGN